VPAKPTATPAATATALRQETTATPAPQPATASPASLWYLLRGGAKLDQAWGVDVDAGHNVYLASFQQAEGQLFTDMVIYKFTAGGEQLWETRWGGKFQEKAFVVAASGPFAYVGGLTQDSADPRQADMAVLALDSNDGRILWSFTWGQGIGYEEVDGLVVDGDAIFISGWTTSAETGGDAALLKLDRQGKLIWAKTWGSPGFDSADGQMVVDADAIYLCGRYNAPNMVAGGQAYVAKFAKADGRPLAQQTWGGPLFNDALGMTSDGVSLYVVGLTIVADGGGQIFLRKFDMGLKLAWERLWGGKAGESARAVAVDREGSALIAGHTLSEGAGDMDIVLLKYRPDGELAWKQLWGGPQADAAQGLVIDGDYAYLAGNTVSFGNGQQDALLLKADAHSGRMP